VPWATNRKRNSYSGKPFYCLTACFHTIWRGKRLLRNNNFNL